MPVGDFVNGPQILSSRLEEGGLASNANFCGHESSNLMKLSTGVAPDENSKWACLRGQGR